jgi:hypothetical protein
VPTQRRTWLAIFAALVLFLPNSGSFLFSQQQPPLPPPSQAPPPPGQAMSPQQLDDLVAPIALYPDPLLGQILAASTYPLELTEAGQWLQQYRGLQGKKLMDEARKQNWDPSIEALVAFPEVVQRLTQDVRWTTDLGNAFLAQQADVMAAVQRMRARAEANGKLMSNQQQNVTTQTQGGQTAIDIQPANPQVVYVPDYNPAWVWGPPVYGYYPPLFYPGLDVGFSFFPGISLGLYFGGCCGWGGWGWGFNWFGGGIFVNNNFFHRYGYREFGERGFRGSEAWAHDPGHRMGVPYGNAAVANRFRGDAGSRGSNFNAGNRGDAGERGAAERGSEARFGSSQFEQRSEGGNHSAFGGAESGGRAQFEGDHGFHSMGGGGFGGGGFRGGGGFGGGGGGHGGGGRR